MRIHDTYSKQPTELQTGPDGQMRVYVCGVTVYDLVHIGHARSYTVFDSLIRYLRARGKDVLYVRNFTDVDDKIIERAKQNGEDALALSARMIDEFYKDMDAIGLLRPDVEPKVSEHIDHIIALVEQLIARGHAYAADGDVFFSVETYADYGKLSGRKIDEQREGVRKDVVGNKRHPYDFALWKSSKPGEIHWQSPWGLGRPGWHIECSAMSMEYLGDTFDLHGGGDDLIFPHHENEIAQSRCGTDGEFARCWMHNGMITVDGTKMGKSLDNFWLLRDVLEVHDFEVIRQFVLSKHYRSPVDYSEKSLHDATEGMRRLYRAVDSLASKAGEAQADADLPELTTAGPEADMAERLIATRAAVCDALDDDFNTGKALGLIFEFAKSQCRAADEATDADTLAVLAARSVALLREMAGWLGLLQRDLAAFEASVDRGRAVADARKQEEQGIDPAVVDDLIAQRVQARVDRNWGRADEIRDELAAMGVAIKDGAEGTTWSPA